MAFTMPYLHMAWWKFFLATLFILFSFSQIFPDHYKTILGLQLSSKTVVKCLVTFGAMMIVSEYFIDLTLDHSVIKRTPEPLLSFWLLQPVFQALNEEMLGRAAAFYVLARMIKKPFVLSLTIALGFTLLHTLFFWMKEGVILSMITSLSLFLAAFATNLIFQKTHHIGWVWVLHAGWNARQFGANYIFIGAGRMLSDGEKFNAIEGDWPVFLLCLTLFLVTCVFVFFKSTIEKEFL